MKKVTTSFMAHVQWNIDFVNHFVVNLLVNLIRQQLMAMPVFSIKKQQLKDEDGLSCSILTYSYLSSLTTLLSL